MVKTGGSIVTYPLIFKAAAYIMGTTLTAGATSALFRAIAEKVNTDKENYKGSYLSPKVSLGPTIAERQDVRPGRELWTATQALEEKVLAAGLDRHISSRVRLSSFHVARDCIAR